jgi:hypothetical protein
MFSKVDNDEGARGIQIGLALLYLFDQRSQ